jgi:hypothetical protein
MRHSARVGATVLGAAAGVLALGSVAHSQGGFLYAAYQGPLNIFEPQVADIRADVMAIGAGPADAAEMAELLATAGLAEPPAPASAAATGVPGPPGGLPEGVFVFPDPGSGPASVPESAATSKQALNFRPVLDDKGRVDCSQAVSCQTDPVTNTTTVTFSDGVVAVVQKVNDLTLVAYRTVADVISAPLQALVPGLVPPKVAASTPLPSAVPIAPAPDPVPTVPAAPAAPAPKPSAAPGPKPLAPTAGQDSAGAILAPAELDKKRPKVTVAPLPEDLTEALFSEDEPAGKPSTRPGPPERPGAALDRVGDAIGSAIDRVGDAIGKAISPGASTKPVTPVTPSADDAAE